MRTFLTPCLASSRFISCFDELLDLISILQYYGDLIQNVDNYFAIDHFLNIAFYHSVHTFKLYL